MIQANELYQKSLDRAKELRNLKTLRKLVESELQAAANDGQCMQIVLVDGFDSNHVNKVVSELIDLGYYANASHDQEIIEIAWDNTFKKSSK